MILISTVITINLSWIYIWKVGTAEMTEASANITLNFLHTRKNTCTEQDARTIFILIKTKGTNKHQDCTRTLRSLGK